MTAGLKPLLYITSHILKSDISLTLVSVACPQHNRLPPLLSQVSQEDRDQDQDPMAEKDKNNSRPLSLCAQFLLCFLANGEFR